MAVTLSTLIWLLVGMGFVSVVLAIKPTGGVWELEFNKDRTLFFVSKTLFNNSFVYLSVLCESKEPVPVTVNWLLRRSPCVQEYNNINETRAKGYMAFRDYPTTINDYDKTEYVSSSFSLPCDGNSREYPEYFNYSSPTVVVYRTTPKPTPAPTPIQVAADQGIESKKGGGSATRRKRASKGGKATDDTPKKTTIATPAKPASTKAAKAVTEKTTVVPLKKHELDKLVRNWMDGSYLFVIEFLPKTEGKLKDMKLKVSLRMSYGDSYLAAKDWPLLIFYGVMGLVYIFYGLFWLVMLACNWRDLLRVQFWIGGVILLGMLEKAVFFAEFESINNTGHSVRGAIIFAELVSCIKRTLARMLVIIVSLGYGIVKPRLGETFPRLLGVGLVFFVLASVESCLRALDTSFQSLRVMIAGIPLAVMDAIICWWIFSSLLQTTRTLRLRRNVVKLSLYRHFTNTLIFSVIASIIFMVWVMAEHRFTTCVTAWKELWVEEAFWHLLFSIILFIIMILWRPTVNNQRYAFTPLLDAAEDDVDDDQALSEAYDGMKMRSTKSQQRNGSSRAKEEKKLEDDLQWVEDNIPSSFTDKVLPVLDSDEEIMNTKFEVSKME